MDMLRSRSRLMRSLSLAALLAAVALVLGACAPTASPSTEAKVAVMNGPAQSALGGSAEAVQAELENQPDRGFALVSAFTMRFLESHTDLFHSRAAASAARIARSEGADLAVMVGAPVLERVVTLSNDEASRRVDVSVALEAQVVDASTDAIVQTLRTRTQQGSRVEANDLPLPDPDEDATVVALMQIAAPELAFSLLAELPYLIKQLLIGSSGG
jgi:hypothetical protein